VVAQSLPLQQSIWVALTLPVLHNRLHGGLGLPLGSLDRLNSGIGSHSLPLGMLDVGDSHLTT